MNLGDDRTLLLVDYNALFRRVLELTQVSLEHNEMPTNGCYGFIAQFCSCVNAVDPRSVIVVSDLKPYIRSKLLPDYKKNHKPINIPPEALSYNYNMVNKFLELLNLPVWMEKGLEADDLLAICCQNFHNAFDRIVIASGDSDLFQLFRYPNLFIRRKIKKKYVMYSREDFRKEYAMTVKQYIRYLCLKGTHNAVPGIKGIGKVNARRIALDDMLWDATYQKHKEELYLYRRLIRLPFSVKTAKFPRLTTSRYPERDIIKHLSRAGIDMNRQIDQALRKLGGTYES